MTYTVPDLLYLAAFMDELASRAQARAQSFTPRSRNRALEMREWSTWKSAADLLRRTTVTPTPTTPTTPTQESLP